LIAKLLRDIGFATVTTGTEPYGLNDVYAIAAKSAGADKTATEPQFGSDPFPKQPRRIIERCRGKLRQLLKG
jgi:hypothetical protein